MGAGKEGKGHAVARNIDPEVAKTSAAQSRLARSESRQSESQAARNPVQRRRRGLTVVKEFNFATTRRASQRWGGDAWQAPMQRDRASMSQHKSLAARTAHTVNSQQQQQSQQSQQPSRAQPNLRNKAAAAAKRLDASLAAGSVNASVPPVDATVRKLVDEATRTHRRKVTVAYSPKFSRMSWQ